MSNGVNRLGKEKLARSLRSSQRNSPKAYEKRDPFESLLWTITSGVKPFYHLLFVLEPKAMAKLLR